MLEGIAMIRRIRLSVGIGVVALAIGSAGLWLAVRPAHGATKATSGLVVSATSKLSPRGPALRSEAEATSNLTQQTRSQSSVVTNLKREADWGRPERKTALWAKPLADRKEWGAAPATAGESVPPANSAPHGRTLAAPRLDSVMGQFHNRIQGRFHLKRIICMIDNSVAYDQPVAADEVGLFDRVLRPGKHTVSVVADYDDNPTSLIGSLEGYHFHLSTSQPIVIHRGDTAQVSVTARSYGGPTTALSERLSLTMNVSDEPTRAPGAGT
jgi:hypothetical protein